MTSEDDWKRQGLYMGPAVRAPSRFLSDCLPLADAVGSTSHLQFDNLDEGVQSEFETYLEERGINSALALFIPDLAEWKEQKCVASE